MITSYTEKELNKDSFKDIRKTVKAYNNYKKWFKFPHGIKGYTVQCIC